MTVSARGFVRIRISGFSFVAGLVRPHTELKFVKAAAKADYCHYSDEHQINGAWSVNPRYRGHICVENFIGLGDKADVRQINRQYYCQNTCRAVEQGHDRRQSRKDKHTNATHNAEAVIYVLV